MSTTIKELAAIVDKDLRWFPVGKYFRPCVCVPNKEGIRCCDHDPERDNLEWKVCICCIEEAMIFLDDGHMPMSIDTFRSLPLSNAFVESHANRLFALLHEDPGALGGWRPCNNAWEKKRFR